MRMPEENEDLTGKICVCSVGRPAIVIGKGSFKVVEEGRLGPLSSTIECWEGLGLDGKGNWASTTPCIIAENAQEFHNKLRDRFDGKMSYNG